VRRKKSTRGGQFPYIIIRERGGVKDLSGQQGNKNTSSNFGKSRIPGHEGTRRYFLPETEEKRATLTSKGGGMGSALSGGVPFPLLKKVGERDLRATGEKGKQAFVRGERVAGGFLADRKRKTLLLIGICGRRTSPVGGGRSAGRTLFRQREREAQSMMEKGKREWKRFFHGDAEGSNLPKCWGSASRYKGGALGLRE